MSAAGRNGTRSRAASARSSSSDAPPPGAAPTRSAGFVTSRTGFSFERPVLERSEKVQQVLLLLLAEPVVGRDHPVRLRGPESTVTRAGVGLDRLDQVPGAPVVEEEEALAEPPQRRGAELVGTGLHLGDV